MVSRYYYSGRRHNNSRASELDSSGDFSVRGSSYSYSSQSPMSLAPAEMLSTEQAAPPSVQAPNFFITNRSHMYAFMPNGGTQISSSKQNDPSFKIPTSRAAQPGPSFVNFHVPVVHGTRHYAPGSKREASQEYRRKQKEHIKSLENRIADMQKENETLIQQNHFAYLELEVTKLKRKNEKLKRKNKKLKQKQTKS
ncbi:cyclic AMP-dependent transcription factor ATF-1-like isoform X2 [Tachysurus fulvidraco]|uniref:cyclic AMP-dependent transcription factor ATF-1-like isoform X2 n=1 Tax=Tachysurus fulvidraco TaxID=1234273 RepID=UPI001FEF65B3|nr:cyclic AMP-dependent transcription factor ATF-1-like isoform X2 [Tachysurus fulvidraco]